MKLEDYEKYRQTGGTYVLPDLLFYELYDEMNEWRNQYLDIVKKAKKLILANTYPEYIYLGFRYLFDDYVFEDLPRHIQEALKGEDNE